MANVVTTPSQGQILVNIEDMSMLKDIKKAISLLKGVGRITVPRNKRLSSYERSLRDLDEGRVYEYCVGGRGTQGLVPCHLYISYSQTTKSRGKIAVVIATAASHAK